MRTFLLLSASLSALATAAYAEDGATEDQAHILPAVTVLATRSETPIDEVAATVTVFTAEQIERQLFTDIKDLVRYEPGVSVVSQPARFGAALGTAGRAGNAGFTIRGMGGDRVLMVVDGVRTPDGFTFGAQSVGRGGYSDLDLMKSVEILRGPASALYGSDGIAGAVSFTTKDPEDLLSDGRSFGARARAGYNSSDEGYTEGMAFAGRSGAFSGLIAYTRRDSQETETNGDVGGTGATRTEANPQDIASNSVLGKLVWDVNGNHRLRLTYDHYDMEMDADVLSGRVPAAPPFVPNAVLELLAHDETTRDRVSLDWRFNDFLGLNSGQVAAYWQEAETTQFTFEDRSPGVDRTRDNQFNNRVVGLAIDGRKTIVSGGVEHRLIFGGDVSTTTQEGIRGGTVPPFGETFPTSPFPKTDYTLAGIFIQDEIVLAGGTVRITPSLRYDAYDLSTDTDPLYTGARADQSDGHLSPKIGAVWQVTPGFQLFGNVSEGFKAPTPSQVNNFFSNIASGYTSIPNPDLDPESSRSAEIGLRMRDQDFAFGRMGFQLVAFRTEYEDFISQQVVGGTGAPGNPVIYQYVNFAEAEVEGLEGRANIDWENGFSARFAAAWANGSQTTDGDKASLSTIDPVKLVGGLAWNDPAGRFGAEAVVTWSDAKKNRDTDGLACFGACLVGEAFTLVDVTAYWNVTDAVTARAGVFNLTDEKYGWWSDIAGVSRTSVARDAYTQPGRNFGVSLSLRL